MCVFFDILLLYLIVVIIYYIKSIDSPLPHKYNLIYICIIMGVHLEYNLFSSCSYMCFRFRLYISHLKEKYGTYLILSCVYFVERNKRGTKQNHCQHQKAPREVQPTSKSWKGLCCQCRLFTIAMSEGVKLERTP